MAVVFVLLSVVLVSCGGPNGTSEPPTYSSEQLEQVQRYETGLQALRDRMPELQAYIKQRDWNNTQDFIRGPLGELRSRAFYLSRSLLPPTAEQVAQLSKALNSHLVRIDEAADIENPAIAQREFEEAVVTFDQMLQAVAEVQLSPAES